MTGLITSSRTGRPAAFLDRDGTINREVNYLRNPADLRLLPGAVDAIRRLNEAGFAVVVVTNQSGVARGFFDEDTLAEIHHRLLERLARRGAVVDAIYYCPHHPEAGEPPYRRACDCRKPAKGMLHRAVRDLGIRIEGSVVVGDHERDVQLAAGTPLRSVRIAPRGRSAEPSTADAVVSTLARAVDWILAHPPSRSDPDPSPSDSNTGKERPA